MNTIMKPFYSISKKIIKYYDVLFITLLAVSITALRYNTFFYPYPINPDEAQMVANAIRMSHFGIGWNVIDGTTSGPLNSAILLLPRIFGFEITFFTTRLIATLLLSSSAIFLYLICRLYIDRKISTLIIYPLIIIYGASRHYDFIHYTSELLPVFLIIASLYLSLKLYSNFKLNKKLFFILGLLIGAVPYCKLQGIPIATVIGLFVLYTFWENRNKNDRKQFTLSIVIFLLGAISTFILFTSISLYTNSFEYFYLSYIMANIGYQATWLKKESFTLFNYTPYRSFFIASLPLIFIARLKSEFKNKQVAIYLLILFLVSIFTVIKPGRFFQHYLNFAIPFFILLPLTVLVTQKIVYSKRTVALIKLATFISIVVLSVNIYKIYKENTLNTYSTKLNNNIHNSLSKGLTYPFITNINEGIFVWGWMAEIYANNQLIPATRTINNIYLVFTKLNIDYDKLFMSTFLSEMLNNRPELIIDAVNGRSFSFHDNKLYGVGSFPLINNIVVDNYTELSTKFDSGMCERVYLRNDIFERRVSKIIIPSSINSSSEQNGYPPKNILDLKVQEGICDTFWLPDYNDLSPSVDILFEKEEKIDKIYILNTTCSTSIQCATDKINLKLVRDNQTISEREIEILPYPLQTEVNINGLIVDKAVIEILSHKGKVGGVNEVTFIKK